MERYRPQARADRVIAVSRFLLALSGAVALLLDPELIPVPLAPPMTVLSFYGIYALIILLLGARAGSPRLRIAQLVVDFVVFCAVIGATHGAVSPFFVFFVFWLFCATLRFGARGAIVAAAATALVYVVLAVSQQTIRSDPGYLLLRISYVAVITLFLLHLARYQQRSGEELLALASWPREVPPRLEALLTQNVRSAARLMDAPRAAIVLEDAEEPWTTVAEMRGGEITVRALPPGDHVPASTDERAVPVSGGTLAGRMVFSGGESWSADDVALAEIAARMVSSQLEQFGAQEGARDARLPALAERSASQWNVAVDVVVTPPSPQLRSNVAAQIYSLVNESLANAAKHANASHVRAAVVLIDGGARLGVGDEATVSPFPGKYALPQLQAPRRGPRTLKER